jgi:hypothetical protein
MQVLLAPFSSLQHFTINYKLCASATQNIFYFSCAKDIIILRTSLDNMNPH